jgi:hypothetical protein
MSEYSRVVADDDPDILTVVKVLKRAVRSS